MSNYIIKLMSRIITYQTYKDYCKKYKIPLSNKKIVNGEIKYSKKSLLQLQKDIYKYENEHDDILNGLYFTDE